MGRCARQYFLPGPLCAVLPMHCPRIATITPAPLGGLRPCRAVVALPMSVLATAALWLLLSAVSTAGQDDPPARGDRVCFLWEDPRAPADSPLDVEPQPGRRWSWRAQRRANRRRIPTEPMHGIGEGDAAEGLEAPGNPPGDDTVRGAGLTLRDQSYATPDREGRRRFDLTLPGRCPGSIPLVVWIHGDSWRDGSKADCPIRWLAMEGYAVASIGYRRSDTARYPAQLDDCRAAIAELARRSGEWGIDPARIAVIGSGGGGHLAALTALDPDDEGDSGQARSTDGVFVPAAFAVIATPTPLPSLGPEHDRPRSAASLLVGGPLPEVREAALRASPLSHVSPDTPPCLIVHGDADRSVPLDQALRFDAALRAAGVPTTLLILEGVGHTPAVNRESIPGKALLEFLNRTLRSGDHFPERGGAIEEGPRGPEFLSPEDPADAPATS